MRIARFALPALLLAAAAQASPLTVSDLASLVRAGIEESAIVRLVETEGLASPVGAADALALREAGMSASLVSRLVTWSAEDGIEVEERDGVVVVSGSGLPEENESAEDAALREAWAQEAWGGEARSFEDAMDSTVPPAPLPEEQAPEGPGYPGGAVFGWTGGAVFIPARFGGSRPSAFGRTIVEFAPGSCAPWLGTPYSTPLLPQALPDRGPGWTTIHTSRGDIRVPN